MRIAASLFILIIILITPYWVYFPAVVLGIVIFPFYIEAIIFGLLIDELYGTVHSTFIMSFPFGMIAALLVLVAHPLRERLRFNA